MSNDTNSLDPADNVFRNALSEIPLKSKENKRDPFFGVTKKDPNAIVDAFEAQQGIRKPKKSNHKVTYDNGIFDPSSADDKEFLNELMNNQEKYKIIQWDKNWDKTGNLNIFVVYGILSEISEDVTSEKTKHE